MKVHEHRYKRRSLSSTSLPYNQPSGPWLSQPCVYAQDQACCFDTHACSRGKDQTLQAIFECLACCRHAVRLWRQMLQSLTEALLSNCPAVVAQDVLGRALLEGVQSISLRYSQLRPSEQWQPRLAADKWYIAETCHLMSQPSDSVYRCDAYQDRSQDIHVTTGAMSSLPCACLHV